MKLCFIYGLVGLLVYVECPWAPATFHRLHVPPHKAQPGVCVTGIVGAVAFASRDIRALGQMDLFADLRSLSQSISFLRCSAS